MEEQAHIAVLAQQARNRAMANPVFATAAAEAPGVRQRVDWAAEEVPSP